MSVRAPGSSGFVEASELRLPALTSEDLRHINRVVGAMGEARDLDGLGRALIANVGSVLPAGYVLWDVWQPGMAGEMVERAACSWAGWAQATAPLVATLEHNIRHHPIIAAGAYDRCRTGIQSLSDYQSRLKFRESPLYREVYRHLQVVDQTLMMVGDYPDGMVFLMVNTPDRVTTDRERAVVHLLGVLAGRIGHRVLERERLERCLVSFQSWVNGVAGLSARVTLTVYEGRLLAGLIRGRSREEIAAKVGCRRDTLDRRLAQLRERFGAENTGQLISGLTRLRAAGK
jgi:DNA-binding CsgD family transcriptional regulator